MSDTILSLRLKLQFSKAISHIRSMSLQSLLFLIRQFDSSIVQSPTKQQILAHILNLFFWLLSMLERRRRQSRKIDAYRCFFSLSSVTQQLKKMEDENMKASTYWTVFPLSLLQKFKLNNEWLNGAVAGVEAGPSNQSRHQFHELSNTNTFKLFRGDWWPWQSFITE